MISLSGMILRYRLPRPLPKFDGGVDMIPSMRYTPARWWILLWAFMARPSPASRQLRRLLTGIILALLFITFPFVVRAVQPVLLSLDRTQEDAAATLGAGAWTIFRRITLPPVLLPLISGALLSFARAIGEFGAIVVVAGNLPMRSQTAAVYVLGEIESDNQRAASAMSVVMLAIAFGLVNIPMTELIKAWEQINEDFFKETGERLSSFTDYHAWYTSHDDTPNHPKENIWPPIFSGFDDELFQDGWHRFHSYFLSGLEVIPVLYYLN